MVSALLLAALPLAAAFPHSASIFAGSTTSAAFPPPGATGTSYEEYFPAAAEVGFAGPTPTGAEPEAIQTAPAAPVKLDTYPLVADGAAYNPSFNPMRYWGNLSPWFSVGGAFGLPEASPQVPSGCELTQVHIVQRHGARYPTSGTNKFAALLQDAVVNGTGFTAHGPLEFLNTWTYKLGAEILTPFGRKQLYDLGVAARVQYGHLLDEFTRLPVFRTTSEWRMVQSARNWAAGFFGLEEYPTSYHEEIIIEEEGYNNTLVPWNDCDNANGDLYTMGSWYANNWTEIYLKDTVKRLQQYVDGVELTTTYVSEMQDLCAYETVSIGYSKFCELFTEEEWKGYQYANDLDFWYADGPGNPTGAAQGIGYVQELVARLTQTPMTVFDTTTNGTLDGNNITFPLDQPIYMDATHDTNIASIAVAMNFTSMVASGPLPVDYIPEDLSYNTQHIAPFAAHLVGQVMTCPVKHSTSDSEKYIRWLLNDGVVPLTGIKYCEEPNKDGLCLLDNFIKGMQERVAEVDFQYDCFGNVSVPYPDNLTNGRYIR
ncbi:histidine phosphatase superfamily [Rhodofomes roseus]|uniref:Histidine phosphatase superfamily n=1 Tax=Rhodofomes roseus TaxID=34475 RepID=A0ABQ8KFQ0_9APHY|nr:histidine phosphatase superfamily [Rhodofomes roseus]KAH9836116.1 histidine phosphatase superfamily [Rhodofomes roseus]